ncbi:MAG: cation:proton antiporter [Actinobacteria bacterium]|nr:cation:proton antiporter [Actinomycetota bacterium]
MNGEVDFSETMLVMVAAVSVPLLLGLFPRVPVPASVLEIVAGIVIGPSVLGWVSPDEAIDVLARLGVAFLLFLAGMELDFRFLRGRPLRLGLAGYALSVGIGLVITAVLGVTDVIIDPLLVAIILSATALGIVVPVLKDTGQVDTGFGRLVIVSCSIAEFGSIVLLSMFFSTSGSPHPLQAAGKLFVLVLAVFVVAVVAARAGRLGRLNRVLFRLQDSSAQIRIRAAVLLLLALLVLSDELKFDAILGAFMAGALLSALTDVEREEDLGHFRTKLEGAGFGLFVPVFFIATGLEFPLDELFSDASTALRIPLFLLIILVVRGTPALLLRHEITVRQMQAAAFMQATTLSFIVVATEIGVTIGEVHPVNAASLVTAGMVSVLVFPAVALALLRSEAPDVEAPARE